MSASKKRRELNRARVECEAARIAAGGAVSSKRLRDTTLEVALQAVDQLRAENRDLIMRNHITHELFETGDPGCPEQALDRNGEVVLGVCKNCGRVEADLAEPCDHRTLIASLRAENERQRAVLEDVKIYLQDSGAPQHIYHRVLEGIFGKVIGGTA